MATDTSRRRSGLPSVEYYAPNYRIEIDGRELDPKTKGDVLQLKVVMDLENMSSFDFTLNNWDDQEFRLKYSDSDVLRMGRTVHIKMGYAGSLRSMLQGQITGLTPSFPEAGPSTVQVSGLDGMFRLRDRKPADGEQKRFEGLADWEIAEVVARRNKLKLRALKVGQAHPLVIQKNQDDAQFIMERAKRIDFDVFVRTDPETGEDELHFERPTDGRDGRPMQQYLFFWGGAGPEGQPTDRDLDMRRFAPLITFSPKLSTTQQVAKVTVRGWDPATKKAITYTATPDDVACKDGFAASGPALVLDGAPSDKPKEDIVVDAPVMSIEEAKDYAVSLLREKAYEYLTGTGKVIGLPDLRPGFNVELRGLGKRFSGCYYIKKVEHTIDTSGYFTTFDVRLGCCVGG